MPLLHPPGIARRCLSHRHLLKSSLRSHTPRALSSPHASYLRLTYANQSSSVGFGAFLVTCVGQSACLTAASLIRASMLNLGLARDLEADTGGYLPTFPHSAHARHAPLHPHPHAAQPP
ncbi:hypothetical protein HYPSUDRAFT_72714 [Hypholoma sublateritium FD-334 SS-4]|uniref:Uncharacterized protein n=1 Tax=Hypholoma sublateritium (strain FD-334 SS-4) TaxID=945553 RepID=A0A0D2LTP9_HYPSF|nr:hypothetical protein HYPSUDRAFT_72714 [Hypholoma sublateritium FD-334 SS-4]